MPETGCDEPGPQLAGLDPDPGRSDQDMRLCAYNETLGEDYDRRDLEPRRVCRRLICLSYAAMSDLSRAA